MFQSTDILLDSNGQDMGVTADGDFGVYNSDEQHIQDISVSNQGAWKNSPVTGVGLGAYLKAPFTLKTKDALTQNISTQLAYDGYSSIVVVVQSLLVFSVDAVRLS